MLSQRWTSSPTAAGAALLAWVGVWLRRALALLISLSGAGVPRHVAFIMDGNRRYADMQHKDAIVGHKQGYSKMVDVIHWCLELGVPWVSVYAFSIDNFRRSPQEVGGLMHLAEEKYIELAQDKGLAEREGVEMRVIGELSFVPPPVQGAAARLMQATALLKHKRAVLNICFSYTGTEELLSAVDALQEACSSGALNPGDVSPALLTACLRTGPDCPPVDLLVRTSGEARLSDFLPWQCSHAELAFEGCLWPDFSFLRFARCVLRWQHSELRTRTAQQSTGTLRDSHSSGGLAAGHTKLTPGLRRATACVCGRADCGVDSGPACWGQEPWSEGRQWLGLGGTLQWRRRGSTTTASTAAPSAPAPSAATAEPHSTSAQHGASCTAGMPCSCAGPVPCQSQGGHCEPLKYFGSYTARQRTSRGRPSPAAASDSSEAGLGGIIGTPWPFWWPAVLWPPALRHGLLQHPLVASSSRTPTGTPIDGPSARHAVAAATDGRGSEATCEASRVSVLGAPTGSSPNIGAVGVFEPLSNGIGAEPPAVDSAVVDGRQPACHDAGNAELDTEEPAEGLGLHLVAGGQRVQQFLAARKQAGDKWVEEHRRL